MRAGNRFSIAAAPRPQSCRASAEVRTKNRPDGFLEELPRRQSERINLTLFQTPKRHNEHQGHRPAASGHLGTSGSVLIGSAIIATAILLSTLVTAVGTRFVGMESSTTTMYG
jgi:hypothetical protein